MSEHPRVLAGAEAIRDEVDDLLHEYLVSLRHKFPEKRDQQEQLLRASLLIHDRKPTDQYDALVSRLAWIGLAVLTHTWEKENKCPS